MGYLYHGYVSHNQRVDNHRIEAEIYRETHGFFHGIH